MSLVHNQLKTGLLFKNSEFGLGCKRSRVQPRQPTVSWMAKKRANRLKLGELRGIRLVPVQLLEIHGASFSGPYRSAALRKSSALPPQEGLRYSQRRRWAGACAPLSTLALHSIHTRPKRDSVDLGKLLWVQCDHHLDKALRPTGRMQKLQRAVVEFDI